MSTNRNAAARICGEQDCDQPPNRPNQPLCLKHYRILQVGDIDECPNCPGVYKPSEYPICRQCNAENRRQPGRQIRERRGEYVDDSKGWNLQPEPEPAAKAPLEVAQAVNRVRENITTHRRACENHETNTVQYLIMPLLKGLGWDEYNPDQVVKEYKPTGRQRYRQAIAVDVALMDNGSPVAFIEAKRLDREYSDDYAQQLSKYAKHLKDGSLAVLTNGRFWQICSVAYGKPILRETIDIAHGTAEEVSEKLRIALGKPTLQVDVNDTPRGSGTSYQTPPNRERILSDLRQYRVSEAGRRGVPPYFIFTNEVISLIGERCPADLGQLRGIPGVGRATVEQHGDAIITIVRGRWS